MIIALSAIITVIVCFIATLIGSICGMGGGIIIKPVLDFLGTYDLSFIHYISSFTVLGMSAYSILEVNITKKSEIKKATGTALAIGASIGGITGREVFININAHLSDTSKVSNVQAVCMLLLTLFCLITTIYKKKITPLSIANISMAFTVGIVLGAISAFLGIGGGPVNVTVLFLLFAMKPKEAAQNSLYIVLICQIFSLGWTIIRGEFPKFNSLQIMLFVLFGLTGIVGSIVGRHINKKIDNAMVDNLFKVVMCVIIVINGLNAFVF